MTLIIAHRGASAEAPENTLAAIEAAQKLGVEWAEVDLRVTRDGVPVVIHDETIDRTTNGTGLVSALSYQEIESLDAGFNFTEQGTVPSGDSPLFPWRNRSVRIPTLQEMLERFPAMGFILEVKEKNPESVLRIANVIRKSSHPQEKLVTGSFDHRTALLLRKELPAALSFLSEREAFFAVVSCRTGLPFFSIRKGTVPTTGDSPLSVSPFWASLPRERKGIRLDLPVWIHFLKKKGISKIVYWTIDDPEEAKRLLEHGADGIITNDPKKFKCPE